MNWEIGIDMYTLICIKWMTNKNLLGGARAKARARVRAEAAGGPRLRRPLPPWACRGGRLRDAAARGGAASEAAAVRWGPRPSPPVSGGNGATCLTHCDGTDTEAEVPLIMNSIKSFSDHTQCGRLEVHLVVHSSAS